MKDFQANIGTVLLWGDYGILKYYVWRDDKCLGTNSII